MRNIYLIGMPGAGKTNIGRLLAKEVRRRFVDIDRQIMRTAGKTVAEIFAEQGEEGFRQLEHDVLRQIAARKNRVVATGGGIVLNPKNIDLMRKSGRVIWLKRPLESILASPRIKKRPLLAADPNRIYTLYEEREALYRQAAHFEINNIEDREATVAAIIALLRR